jgi:hypothetical protein
VVEDFEIEHSALGWKKFRERIKAYGSIPFAIETSQGVRKDNNTITAAIFGADPYGGRKVKIRRKSGVITLSGYMWCFDIAKSDSLVSHRF